MTTPGTAVVGDPLPELGNDLPTTGDRRPACLARLVQHPHEALRKTSESRR